MAVEITETPRHTLTVSEQNWQLKLSTLSAAALPDDATFNTVTVNSILTAGTVTAGDATFAGVKVAKATLQEGPSGYTKLYFSNTTPTDAQAAIAGDGANVVIGAPYGLYLRGNGVNNHMILNSSGNLSLTGNITASGTVTAAEAMFNGLVSQTGLGGSTYFGEGAGIADDLSANNNVGVGFQALAANTTGNGNTASGYQSLFSNTTGYNNTASGLQALRNNTEGRENTASGHQSLRSNITGNNNTASGYASLYYNTTGVDNTASGYLAGTYIADGNTANQTSSTSIYLGADTKALANGDTNEIVIGYAATGAGSNSVTLGNESITKTVLRGDVETDGTVTAGTITANGNLTVNPTGAVKVEKSGTPQFTFGGGSGNYTYRDFYAISGNQLGLSGLRWGSAWMTNIDASGTVTASTWAYNGNMLIESTGGRIFFKQGITTRWQVATNGDFTSTANSIETINLTASGTVTAGVAGAGSYLTPTLTVGDANTGFYHSATNRMGFSVAATKCFNIYSRGLYMETGFALGASSSQWMRSGASGIEFASLNTGGSLIDISMANLTASGTVQTGSYTVETLPIPPSTGMRAQVTDSSVAAHGHFGTTVTAAGGGTEHTVPVFYDGTNWIIA